MADRLFTIYEKRDQIAYVTINRPEVLNAINPGTNAELSEIWTDFEQDDDLRVAIFTGAGERAFSAGMDLRAAAEAASRGERPRAVNLGGFGGFTNPRAFISKPIIAAVNGYALGGGMEMALACDIIIAADHAQMGLPEVKRGFTPGGGGVHRLPRQIPLKIAMGYLLTGKHMPAQEAARWGLVNAVVPLAELLPTAEQWARDIIECAPLAIRAVKQAALQGLELPLTAAINGNYYWVQATHTSEDALEGPRAFAEKRAPQWKGR